MTRTGESTSCFKDTSRWKSPISRFARAALFLSPLVLALAVLAQEREVIDRGDVAVSYDQGRRGLAEAALDVYGKVRGRLEAALGLSFLRKSYIYVCGTEQEFKDATRGETELWVSAVAYPGNDLIVIDGPKLAAEGNDLYTVMAHELTHLLLGQIPPRGVKLPVWLNEGIATWASRPLFAMPREELVLAAKAGRLLPPANLADGFPSTQREVELAYAESYAFVVYLEERFGEGFVKSLVGQMMEGKQVDEAMMGLTGESAQGLWADWEGELARSSAAMATVKVIFRRGIGFFSVLAVVVILAFVRYLYVRRRKMKAWEEEEGMGMW